MITAGGSAVPEAAFSHPLENGYAECRLCFRNCRVAPGGKGVCSTRYNVDGRLVPANYGQVSSMSVDSIEKKPLYHFYPGTNILSLGTVGCNLKCSFCQNWQISQQDAPTQYVSPEEVLAMATKARDRQGSIGVAFTYSEPLVWFEFVRDTAKLLAKEELKVVLVTNGTIERDPLLELLPLVDAMNIDVKGFTDRYYAEVCGGDFDSVKRTVELSSKVVHVELTTLVVPGQNDTIDEIGELARWVASLDADMPLHLSRYFPMYKMTEPATPLETLEAVRNEALRYLRYVFVGNASIPHSSDTICPNCHETVIAREGYHVDMSGLQGNSCSSCRRMLSIIA